MFRFRKETKKGELKGYAQWLKDKAGIHTQDALNVSMRARFKPYLDVIIRRHGLLMVVREVAESGHAMMIQDREVLLDVEFESFLDLSEESWTIINRHLEDSLIQAMKEAYITGPFA